MARPDDLIRELQLQPHFEGGWYAEVFRSGMIVAPVDGRGSRAALTTIYFLLTRGQASRLHRVTSDEAWHFYEGDPLELTMFDEALASVERVTLGRVESAARPVHVVPAGAWQAARSLGEYTLVGCSVGPGFDFADFSMLEAHPAAVALLRSRYPEYGDLV